MCCCRRKRFLDGGNDGVGEQKDLEAVQEHPGRYIGIRASTVVLRGINPDKTNGAQGTRLGTGRW